MKHLVLIGDLVASRHVGDRAALQRRLKNAVRNLNRRHGKRLTSPFTVTLGDEFQAIYRDAETVFGDVFFLLHALSPVRVRFSLAVGKIDTPLNREQAIGMDGPAFHDAREIMDRLKTTGRLLGVGGLPAGITRFAEPMLAILSGQIDSWRDTRLRLLSGLLEGADTAALAKITQITPRAVNKNIRAADLDEWTRVLLELAGALNTALKS